jgi:hypothetical protein
LPPREKIKIENGKLRIENVPCQSVFQPPLFDLEKDEIQTCIERLQFRQVVDVLQKVPRVREAVCIANEEIGLDLLETILAFAAQAIVPLQIEFDVATVVGAR